jgi:hypothetical protein
VVTGVGGSVVPEVAAPVPVALPVPPDEPAGPEVAEVEDVGLLVALPVVPPKEVAEVVEAPVLPDVALPLEVDLAGPELPPTAVPVTGPELPLIEMLRAAPEPPPPEATAGVTDGSTNPPVGENDTEPLVPEPPLLVAVGSALPVDPLAGAEAAEPPPPLVAPPVAPLLAVPALPVVPPVAVLVAEALPELDVPVEVEPVVALPEPPPVPEPPEPDVPVPVLLPDDPVLGPLAAGVLDVELGAVPLPPPEGGEVLPDDPVVVGVPLAVPVELPVDVELVVVLDVELGEEAPAAPEEPEAPFVTCDARDGGTTNWPLWGDGCAAPVESAAAKASELSKPVTGRTSRPRAPHHFETSNQTALLAQPRSGLAGAH